MSNRLPNVAPESMPQWLAENPWLMQNPATAEEADRLLQGWDDFLTAEETAEPSQSPDALPADPTILEEGIFTDSDQLVVSAFGVQRFEQGEVSPVEDEVMRTFGVRAALDQAMSKLDPRAQIFIAGRYGLSAPGAIRHKLLDGQPKSAQELALHFRITDRSVDKNLSGSRERLGRELRPFVDADNYVTEPLRTAVEYPMFYAYDPTSGRPTADRLMAKLKVECDAECVRRLQAFIRDMMFLTTRTGFPKFAERVTPVAVQTAYVTFAVQPENVEDSAITAKIYERNAVQFHTIGQYIEKADLEIRVLHATRQAVAKLPPVYDTKAQLLAVDAKLRMLALYKGALLDDLLAARQKAQTEPQHIIVSTPRRNKS